MLLVLFDHQSHTILSSEQKHEMCHLNNCFLFRDTTLESRECLFLSPLLLLANAKGKFCRRNVSFIRREQQKKKIAWHVYDMVVVPLSLVNRKHMPFEHRWVFEYDYRFAWIIRTDSDGKITDSVNHFHKYETWDNHFILMSISFQLLLNGKSKQLISFHCHFIHWLRSKCIHLVFI